MINVKQPSDDFIEVVKEPPRIRVLLAEVY
jgi:hypothetical protein